MDSETIHSHTGRVLDELNIENILAGRLTTEDFRISADTLVRQAEAAEAAGSIQLGQNFRRAAELTHLSNEKVLEIYNALRPGRTTFERLMALVEELEGIHAPLTAVLVREAAEVYRQQGILARE